MAYLNNCRGQTSVYGQVVYNDEECVKFEFNNKSLFMIKKRLFYIDSC